MINVPTYNTRHAVRNTSTEKTDLKLLKNFSSFMHSTYTNYLKRLCTYKVSVHKVHNLKQDCSILCVHQKIIGNAVKSIYLIYLYTKYTIFFNKLKYIEKIESVRVRVRLIRLRT